MAGASGTFGDDLGVTVTTNVFGSCAIDAGTASVFLTLGPFAALGLFATCAVDASVERCCKSARSSLGGCLYDCNPRANGAAPHLAIPYCQSDAMLRACA